MEQKWFETTIRVRYSETDAMQIVYHANYLAWFEVGRTEMMRDAGIPYRELEQHGILLPVIEARMFYHAPARYDELLIIRSTLEHAHVRLRFTYEILRQDDRKLLVDGYTIHAWVNRDMRPIQLRKAVPEFYQKLQAYMGE
jgi:acyl-CoA thioester hydrolase